MINFYQTAIQHLSVGFSGSAIMHGHVRCHALASVRTCGQLQQRQVSDIAMRLSSGGSVKAPGLMMTSNTSMHACGKTAATASLVTRAGGDCFE